MPISRPDVKATCKVPPSGAPTSGKDSFLLRDLYTREFWLPCEGAGVSHIRTLSGSVLCHWRESFR